jgi:glycosyltransferase involved in cell wall biosynthesis
MSDVREHVMTVSVIVPTFNGGPWILEQLAALSKQTYAGEWDLIIADNGSTDDTRSLAASARQRFVAFRLLDASDVRGQSYARNCAAHEASGDVLLFTDQDDIVSPNWIALLTAGLSKSPIVTGPVRHFVDGRAPSGDNVQRPHDPLAVGPFAYPIGCNMGIERDLFLELGGFSENATRGWEDVDLGIRAALRGISTTWVQEAVVLHRRPSSVRVTWRKEFAYGRGWTKLERQHPQISPDGWVRPLLRRAGWVALRSPYVALPARRRGWVVRAAGLAGRIAERVRPRA